MVQTKVAGSAALPALFIVVCGSTLIAAALGDAEIGGFHLTGWAWVVPWAYSALVLVCHPRRVRFPWRLWMPWCCFLLVHWCAAGSTATQRTVQMTAPLLVGVAASTCRLSANGFRNALNACALVAVLLWVAVVVNVGIANVGTMSGWLPLPGQVMTGCMLATVFAAAAVLDDSRWLRWWTGMMVLPVVAVTRTAILTTALTLPSTLAKTSIKRRIALLAVVLIVGFAAFLSPGVQHKMFDSGHGTFADATAGEVQSNGRFLMWEAFLSNIESAPWLGHGTGGAEAFTRYLTDGELSYPHNDWLLTAYDYGVVGVVLYVLSLLGGMRHAVACGERTSGVQRIFFAAGASAFIPYMVFMVTDNVVVYSSFFGNLQFLVLGLAYGGVGDKSAQHKLKSWTGLDLLKLSVRAHRKSSSRAMENPGQS